MFGRDGEKILRAKKDKTIKKKNEKILEFTYYKIGNIIDTLLFIHYDCYLFGMEYR